MLISGFAALTCRASDHPPSVMSESLESLAQSIESSLAREPSEARLRLARAERALTLLDGRGESASELAAKARFSACAALLRLGREQECAPYVDWLDRHLTLDANPELFVRSRALKSSVIAQMGDFAAASDVLAKVLELDLSEASAQAVLFARGNYAIFLQQSGDILSAVREHEEAVAEALDAGLIQQGLAMASNLLELLLMQGRIDHARAWINANEQRLIIEPDSIYSARFVLSALRVAVREGRSQWALPQLRELVDGDLQYQPYTLGSACLTLAEALLMDAQLDEAVVVARRAVAALEPWPSDRAEAALILAKALVGKGLSTQALGVLAEHGDAPKLAAIYRAEMERVRLDALLQQGRLEDAFERASIYSTARAAALERISLQGADYYASKLASVERVSELDRLRRAQRVDAARRMAGNAAELLKKQRRQLFLVAVVLLGLLMFAFGHLDYRRRLEGRLRKQESIASRHLERRVEDATAALREVSQDKAVAQHALERKRYLQTVGSITGSVAHDYNNFLQVMLANNDLIGGNKLSEIGSKALQAAKDACDRCANIIRQLLAYSSRQRLSPEPLKMSEYLADTTVLFQTSVGEQIKVEVIDESVPDMLMVDAAALTTALLELLRNAAEAMPKGGTITLEIQRAHRSTGPVDQQASGNQRYLTIAVKDTGTGMSEEDVQNAVEPFFTTKDQPDGAGMGLSSVRGFARQSGGDVGIKSVPGKGTDVTMWLPALKGESHPKAEERDALESLEGAKILLVEDHATVAQTLRTTLTAEGSEVTIAGTAEEAQAAIRSGLSPRFDLILSDIRMPGTTDGIALARWVLDREPATHIVLMSGFNEDRAAPLGVAVLQKPFTVSELKRVATSRD